MRDLLEVIVGKIDGSNIVISALFCYRFRIDIMQLKILKQNWYVNIWVCLGEVRLISLKYISSTNCSEYTYFVSL